MQVAFSFLLNLFLAIIFLVFDMYYKNECMDEVTSLNGCRNSKNY